MKKIYLYGLVGLCAFVLTGCESKTQEEKDFEEMVQKEKAPEKDEAAGQIF